VHLSCVLYQKADVADAGVYNEHPDVIHRVDTAIRYEGYIEKLHKEIERFRQQESMMIPETFSYDKVQSLSTEGRVKLSRIRPSSLGQASRIPGVSASDVSILALYLR
jgi:tRNA uridine 5-carboxymethylaminomethyl modification enzyme